MKGNTDPEKALRILKINVGRISREAKESGGLNQGTTTKVYPVNANTKLTIENKYGNVTVITWDRNEIKVLEDIARKIGPGIPVTPEYLALSVQKMTLEIKKPFDSLAYKGILKQMAAQNKLMQAEQAKYKLAKIAVEDTKEGDVIHLKTTIENVSTPEDSVRINYTVYVPYTLPLSVDNSYGDIKTGDLAGPVNLTASYGDITAGMLRNTNNTLKSILGSVTVSDMKGGGVTISHGKLLVRNAGNIITNLEYTPAKFENVYGNHPVFSFKFSNDFVIGSIDKTVRNMVIECYFSSILIGSEETSNFNFTVRPDLKFNKDKVTLKRTIRDAKGVATNYIGRYGKPSVTQVVIVNNHSSVQFL